MKPTPLFKSSTSYGAVFLWTLISVFFAVAGFTNILLALSSVDIYVANLILGIFFLLIPMGCIAAILSTSSLDVYDDHIIVRNFLGITVKTINTRDIIFWAETTNEQNKLSTLSFQVGKSEWQPEFDSNTDYQQMKRWLEEHHPIQAGPSYDRLAQEIKEENNRSFDSKSNLLVFLYGCLYLLAAFFGMYIYSNGPQKVAMVKLPGILLSEPKIRTGKTDAIEFVLAN